METGPQNPWPGEIPISLASSSMSVGRVKEGRAGHAIILCKINNAPSHNQPWTWTGNYPTASSRNFNILFGAKNPFKNWCASVGSVFSENPFLKGGQKLHRQFYMHTLHSACEVERHHQQFSHQTKHTAGCIINPRAFHATFFRPNDLSMTRNRLKNVFLITGKAGPSPPANTPLREGNLTFLPNGRKSLTGFT